MLKSFGKSKGGNMGKQRGQVMIIVGAIIFFIAFIIILALLPAMGGIVNSSTSNATLFPTNGATYTLANLTPAIWVIAPILAFIMFVSYGGMSNRPI